MSIFDALKEHTAINAAYNSSECESEHASICEEDTRKDVLQKISAWSGGNPNHPVCWLEGPAGSGKSTIARTIAKQCDDNNRLAFSFFFSRGKQGCSDTTKFVPTFASQLAKSFPAIQPLMQRALTEDPFTPHLRLRDQIENLIIRPARTIQTPIPPMIVVVDGLDECGDDDLLQTLIGLLADAATRLPFRFLFASRPEFHIRQAFETSSVKHNTRFLSLRDFRAHSDIRNYLRLHLSEIHDQNDDVMGDVARPWPSQRELDILVAQSDGLFIYVSTLVKFVADKTQHPQQRLQAAMTTHSGVDPLYNQVLVAARKFKDFERVIGAIVYVRRSLTVSELGQLLQLQSGDVRLALRGCQSVLAVPDTDQKPVHPHHASLQDFLRDHNRAGVHFCDPQVHHVSIWIGCLESIKQNENYKGGKHLFYVCQNWCYHLHMALSHHATIGAPLVTLMQKMGQEWLRIWMYGLKDLSGVRNMIAPCQSVMARGEVSFLLKHLECLLIYIWLREYPQSGEV